jgi:hypothetical protein
LDDTWLLRFDSLTDAALAAEVLPDKLEVDEAPGAVNNVLVPA